MIRSCNERLSFFEVVCFARDFDIVPKLITKATLAYLHKVSSALPSRSTSQREARTSGRGLRPRGVQHVACAYCVGGLRGTGGW